MLFQRPKLESKSNNVLSVQKKKKRSNFERDAEARKQN